MVANGGPSSMRYITIPLGCSAWGEGREYTNELHSISKHYLKTETSSICITHWKNLEVFRNSFGIHSEHIRIRNSSAITHQVASGQGEKLGN